MKKFLSKIKNIISQPIIEETKEEVIEPINDTRKIKNVLFLTDSIGISAYTLTNSWVTNVQDYLRENGIKSEVISDVAMHINFIENTFRDSVNIHHFDLVIASIGYSTSTVPEFRKIADKLSDLVSGTKTKIVFLEIPPIEEAFKDEITTIFAEKLRDIRSEVIHNRDYGLFDAIETFQAFYNPDKHIDTGLFIKNNYLPNMKGNRILGELVINYIKELILREEGKA